MVSDWCPSSLATMWIGRPPATASVAKALRKSCGVSWMGSPSTPVIPARLIVWDRSG